MQQLSLFHQTIRKSYLKSELCRLQVVIPIHLDKHQVMGFGIVCNLNTELNFSFSAKILALKFCKEAFAFPQTHLGWLRNRGSKAN